MGSITGGKAITIEKPKEAVWISEKMWSNLNRLSEISPFGELIMMFNEAHHIKMFEDIANSA